MVNHHKIIPNQHFHKKWQTSSRGPLHIKSWFNQPGKKKSRRLKRAAKAAANAPRPADKLRPLVRCQTQQHNAKVRLGRGFSLAELKAAKIPVPLAKTIGISVDSRRTNKSAESLAANVARLTEYKAKLVLFPKKGTKAKKGDTADAAARAAATQCADKVLMAPAKAAAPLPPPYFKQDATNNNPKMVRGAFWEVFFEYSVWHGVSPGVVLGVFLGVFFGYPQIAKVVFRILFWKYFQGIPKIGRIGCS